jgi:hypothetical protein
MPLSYIVQYSTDNATWTTLSNVQAININIGRQAMLDQYSASTASLTIRYPNGYASPIADMVSGTYIRIQSPNTTDPYYSAYFGTIKDVNVSYGIPYAGSVGNADYLNVTIEGYFASASRMQGNSYAMGAGLLNAQLSNMNTETLINVMQTFNPSMGAATISSSWGDWLNSVLVTTNGRMVDSQQVEGIVLRGPFNQTTCTVNFSDVANNATNQVYDQTTFGSLSDNFFTQVTVDPADYAAQTVTKTAAVKPYRTYAVNTLSASASQALDQANFLLSQYQTQKFALTSVSCLAEAQSSFKLDKMGLSQLGEMIGARVSVTFRGTVYQSVIEGIAVTATPESSRYTYYLSGADLNNYLILNNTVFGTLNNNKLGY